MPTYFENLEDLTPEGFGTHLAPNDRVIDAIEPEAVRENIHVDKDNRVLLELLDGLEYKPDGQPVGVLISGLYGVGKTFPALATLRRLGRTKPAPHVGFIRYGEWLASLRETHEPGYNRSPIRDLLDNTIKPRILLVDGLAEGRGSEFAHEQCTRLIEARCYAGQITLFTTNLGSYDDPEWALRIGGRATSRLFGLCKKRVVKVTGLDRRLL